MATYCEFTFFLCRHMNLLSSCCVKLLKSLCLIFICLKAKLFFQDVTQIANKDFIFWAISSFIESTTKCNFGYENT